MGRIMKVICDGCKKEITGQDYQTMTVRRYTGQNHDKCYRLPTIWVCDKCYKRMALYMSFSPYESE